MAAVGGVLCCGNIVFDMPVYPAEDVGWNKTKWVETIAESIGGNGANTSFTLAMLGVPVSLVSLVGDDERGERLIGILRAAGVDTSAVGKLKDVPTPATVVLVQEGGARKFYHRPGASRELDTMTFEPGPWTHFHFANPFALPKLRQRCGDVMQRAKEAGMTTSIDTGWDSLGRWLEDLGPALPFTDLFFANDSEAAMLGGEETLRARGVKDVVIKTGAEGCLVNGEPVPGFAVQAVDSTGAGDCFVGAFLAGLHRGLSMPECARLANAVGAMNVERLGSTTGVRGYDETLAWMDAHTGEHADDAQH